MSLSGRSLGSVVMLDNGNPFVPLSGLGEIELDSTLVSPGTVAAAMDDVDAAVRAMKTDVATATLAIQTMPDGQRFLSDWARFSAAWRTWYDGHRRTSVGGFTYLIGAAVAQTRRSAAEYNALEARFRALGFTPTEVSRGPGAGGFLPTEAWVGIGIGAGVLALGFIAWTASSVSKVAAPIARAGTRGRKR